MNDRKVFVRILLIILAVLSVWIGLGARLAYLHLGNHEAYKKKIHRMWRSERTLIALRGEILDRNGSPLAMNLRQKNVAVDPKVIQESGRTEEIATTLAAILQMKRAKVLAALRLRGTEYHLLSRHVEPVVSERVEAQNLPGVWTDDAVKRQYPHGSLACQVLGFVTLYGDSYGGIEKVLDKELRGEPGRRISLRDGKRRPLFATIEEEPAKEGNTVQLTLDMHIQHLVEEALVTAVETNRAKGAWAVVQEVKTGRILAMASVPSFDLNDYSSGQGKYLNPSIGYTYEPGSTMKTLVFAAVFNEGLATEHETIDCEDGVWYYRGRPLRDHGRHGVETVADVLKVSSNIGTAKLALRLGEKGLDQYLRAFGIGRPTDLGLLQEEGGLFPSYKRWDKLTVTRVPMGHAVGTTALQMVTAYSAVANGGHLMRPRIIERILDAEGNVVMQSEPEEVGRPIRSDTSATIRRLLQRVTEDGGTARRARVAGYSVAGKTGTSEKVVNGHYVHSLNIASFAGFLPAENPELSILVVVDEPKASHFGGTVAAPVFRDISEQVVRYLHIPPGGRESQAQYYTQMETEPPVFEVR